MAELLIPPLPDASDKETIDSKGEENWYKNEAKRLENLGIAQDIEERKNYAKKTFKLIAFWIFGIFIILIFQGFALWSFQLSEAVLLAVIGGTTASIISIFIFVMKYLFQSRP